MDRKDRVVRVFVSSTFRDMFFDREVLVKHVFPELSVFCRKRGVEFTGIDLRTGVTAEQSESGMTLHLCLQEVDRCRPYFLCMLGERYGWHVPPTSNGETLLEKTFDNTVMLNPQYSWINQYRDRSVTELEIRHGALNNVFDEQRAFFYFREQGYENHLLNEGKITSAEFETFHAENEDSRERLEALKNEICARGFNVTKYRHHDDIRDLVVKQLKAAIAKDFPEQICDSPLLSEQREHRAFAESRCKVYICRQEYYDALDRYIFPVALDPWDTEPAGGLTASTSMFTVHGPSGVGKSSLLANWAQKLLDLESGHWSENTGSYLHTHFVGCSSASADPVMMMQRLISELQERFGTSSSSNDDESVTGADKSALTSDWDDLVMMLPPLLAEVSTVLCQRNASRRAQWRASCSTGSDEANRYLPSVLVIVLDAVNQLTDTHLAKNLNWLPESLPAYVKVVVSTTQDLSAKAVDETAVTSSSSTTDATATRSRTRTLSREAMGSVAGGDEEAMRVPVMEQTPSLLHCVSGSSTIGRTPSSDDVSVEQNTLQVEALDSDSVRSIAINYMKDFGKTLAEEQLRMLCACEQTKSPLFLRTVLEEVRVWGHFELLDSQISRYLSKDTIGELFESVLCRMEDDYNSAEHPSLVQDALRALACSRCGLSESDLQDIVKAPRVLFSGFFLAIQQSLTNRNGLLHFFHDYLRKTVEEKYLSLSQSATARVNTHKTLAVYFAGTEASYSANRKRNLDELLWHLQKSGMVKPLKVLLRFPSVAALLYDTNRVDLFRMWRECGGESEGYLEAGKAYTEECAKLLRGGEYRIGQESLEELQLERFSFLTHIITVEQESMSAMTASERVVVGRKIADFLVQAAQYSSAGTVLNGTQNLVQTEQERMTISLDRAGLSLSLCKYQDGIQLCQELLSSLKDGVGEKGEVGGSTKKRRTNEAEEDVSSSLSPTFLPEVRYTLAKLYSGNGQYKEADELFAAVYEYRLEEYGANRRQTADVLNEMAKHAFSQRKYSVAFDLFERVLAIKRITIGENSSSFIQTVREIGMFYHDLADFDVALRYFEHALDVTEKIYGPHHPAVSDVLNEMAFTKYTKQKVNLQFEEAIALYERALQIRVASYGEFHKDTAITINHLANVFRAKLEAGDASAGAKAVELYTRAKVIKEHVFPARHPEVLLSRNNLANVLLMEGKYEEAAVEHELVLSIRQDFYGPDHLQTATSYKNCGLAHKGLGNFDDSLKHHFRALQIRENGFGEMHPKTAESLACIGDVYVAMGHPHEALPYYHRAVGVWDEKWGGGNKSSDNARGIIAAIEKGEQVLSTAAKFF